jgi:hypothetical protein
VTEITEDGAVAHIDMLAKKYTGDESYAGHKSDET